MQGKVAPFIYVRSWLEASKKNERKTLGVEPTLCPPWLDN